MSIFADAILIDPNELRLGAASLRRAADESMAVRQRLPGEAWGAPEWQAAALGHELGLVRLELERLVADFLHQADAMERRADEVDGAERRWWAIANGELRCGCVLPDGTVAAVPTMGTAASAAWGPGVGQMSPPITIGTATSSASGGPVATVPPIIVSPPASSGNVIVITDGGGLPGASAGGVTQPGNGVVIGGGVIPTLGPGATFRGGGMSYPVPAGAEVHVPGSESGGFDPSAPGVDDFFRRQPEFGPMPDGVRVPVYNTGTVDVTGVVRHAGAAVRSASNAYNSAFFIY